MRNFLGLICLVLFQAFVIILLSRRQSSSDEEIKSYKELIKSKETEVKVWKDNEGLWRSKLEVSLITNREAIKTIAMYDKSFIELKKDFSSLKKDMKNLESFNSSSYSSDYYINSSIKDTVFIGDTVSYYHFKDSTFWNSCNGIIDIKNNKINISVQSRDSIVSIVTKQRRLLRKPIYNNEQKSFNPNTKILNSRFILVKTKRRFL